MKRLTDTQVAAALATVQQAQQLRETMQARRGGNLLSESWPGLREAREERAQRV